MEGRKGFFIAVCLFAGGIAAAKEDAALTGRLNKIWAGEKSRLTSSALRRAPQQPVEPGHVQVAHMYITRKAFEMYMAQFPGSELAQYIGAYSGNLPAQDTDGSIVEGSYDEDMDDQTPFNDFMSSNRHFWNPYGDLYRGMVGADTGVNRAHKYLKGGFGINGAYDAAWSNNTGKKKGIQGQGAVYLYQHGQKEKAFWYLGHIVHLLEDLTVPAHTHLWPHIKAEMDRYETYMSANHARWSALPNEPIEEFSSLLDLFKKTAETTHGFDCGHNAGLGGVDGSVDKGSRRAGGFTSAELDQEGDVLMPLAVKRAASLFRFFFKQVDRKAPKVKLIYPASSDSTRPDITSSHSVELRASVQDKESGVDLSSYRFSYSYWTGRQWSVWADLPTAAGAATLKFKPQRGTLYAFKISVSDAAGNKSESNVQYLSRRKR